MAGAGYYACVPQAWGTIYYFINGLYLDYANTPSKSSTASSNRTFDFFNNNYNCTTGLWKNVDTIYYPLNPEVIEINHSVYRIGVSGSWTPSLFNYKLTFIDSATGNPIEGYTVSNRFPGSNNNSMAHALLQKNTEMKHLDIPHNNSYIGNDRLLFNSSTKRTLGIIISVGEVWSSSYGRFGTTFESSFLRIK